MSGQTSIPPYGKHKDTAVDDSDIFHTRDVDDPLITQLHEYTTPSMAQPIPIPQPRAFGTLPRRPSLSTSSETSFGSFISATDHHPLGSPSTSSLRGSPTISRTQHGEASSMHSAFDGRGLFEKFGEEAKMRSKDNEQRVLGEIIEHEDDPLQWLENSGDTSSSREESRESAPKADLSDGGKEVLPKEEMNESNSVQTLLQEAMLVDLERTSTRSTESNEDSMNRAAQTMLSSSPTSSSFIFGRSRSLSRAASSSKSSVTESGSSSRTPTPKRSMDASTTSTTSSSPSQSFSTSVGSLSRSWVSSFLGSTSSKISSTLQAVRGHVDQQQQRVEESESPNSSSPPVPSLDSKGDGGSHQEEQDNSKTKPQSTLPTLLPSQKRSSLARFFDSSSQADTNAAASGSNPDSHSQPQQHEHAHAHPYPQHAKTISSSSSSTFAKHSSLPAHPKDAGTRTLTHGTPFAPHLFTGAEGAPGFAGMNRKWNEHGYNFDENDAKDMRGRGIKLVGRKEITTPVLTEEMADLVGEIVIVDFIFLRYLGGHVSTSVLSLQYFLYTFQVLHSYGHF